jgi:hypothetical protein
MNQPVSRQVRDTMRALATCADECAIAATTALEGPTASPQRARLLLDTVAICGVTGQALARKSQFQSQFADLCVQICATCADELERDGLSEPALEACRAASEGARALFATKKSEILSMASKLPPTEAPVEDRGDGV